MPNGFEAFATNAMALGQQWRAQRKERKLAEALSVLDTDPDAAVAGVTKVDPIAGFNMRRQLTADAQAAAEAQRAKVKDTLATATTLLRPAAMDPAKTPETLGRAFDSVLPILGELGMEPAELAQWKQTFMQNPGIVEELDSKLRVVPPGGALTRGGAEVYRNPMGLKTIQVRRGDGGVDVLTIDPNSGAVVQPGTVAAPVSTGGSSRTTEAPPVATSTELPATILENGAKTGVINPVDAAHIRESLGPNGEAKFQEWMRDNHVVISGDAAAYSRAPTSGSGPAPARSGGGGGGSPNVTYSTPGKPPPEPKPGYTILTPQEVADLGLNQNVRWQRSDKGEIKPIGGLAQLNPANIQKMEKKQQIYDSITSNMQRMENAANALINSPGLDRASGTGSYFPTLRGGKAADFEANLNALKSQIGFAILNDMRQMSPTGGALGNVSNFEVDTLQRNIAALDLTQSPAQLRANLKNIVDYARKLRERYARAYNTDKSSLLGDQANAGSQTGGRAIPKEAIDTLRSNPSPQRRQQFDQVFGQGAAKRVLGGK